jgi:hypothetical protein
MKRLGNWLFGCGLIGLLLMIVLQVVMYVNDSLLRYDTVIEPFLSKEMMNTVIVFGVAVLIGFALMALIGILIKSEHD